MAYNKGRAEREWLKWKQAEEQIVNEVDILYERLFEEKNSW